MIKKFAVPLSLVAVATLAACAGHSSKHDTVVMSATQTGVVYGTAPAGYVLNGYVYPSMDGTSYVKVTTVQPVGTIVYTGPQPIPGTVRTGTGKITLLTDLSGPVADVSTQRVTLRMKDGSLQTLDVRGEQLRMGEEISIRADNSIRREPSA